LLSWAQGKWSARKKKKLVREKLRLLCQQSKQSGCKKRDVAQTTTGAQERSQTEKKVDWGLWSLIDEGLRALTP
jgi:hypothetical protein